jgi:hypothetical protein
MNNPRTTPDNPAISGDGVDNQPPARSRYAADIECAIGLNIGAGRAEGVHRVRDAVLAVHDTALAQARAKKAEYRHKAIQRAILLGRYETLLGAIREFAAEETTASNDWGDGYRQAVADLVEILDAFPTDQQPAT